MLDRLLSFVLDRQPVQTATGIAGLLIAGLGLAHEFDVLESLTVGQVTALGTFLTVLAGWLAHLRAWSPMSVEQRVLHEVTVAAGQAATSAAIDLGPKTVGAVGDITEAGLDVVAEVVDEVTDTVDDEDR